MSVFTPQSIKELRDLITAQGGRPSIARFCEPESGRGFRGYHLGRSQIMNGASGCPPSFPGDYSIQTARDKAGLSDARSAIDITFGKARLQALSKWLVNEARSDAPGTSDIREIIYSPDGIKVLRWDRERGFASTPREGEADLSHRFHTHISFYRDSENRRKVPMFAEFFGIASPPQPTPEEPDVTTDQVKALQTALNQLGASPPLVVDGIYGAKTEAAISQVVANYNTAQTKIANAKKALA